MAKKTAPKVSMTDMSAAELTALLRESQEKSFKLKFQHATNPLKNPMEIRTARRQIAQLLTVLHQKETAVPAPVATAKPAPKKKSSKEVSK